MFRKAALLSAFIAVSFAFPASAQEWPPAEVEVMTHSSPGGGGDRFIRNLVQTLEQNFDVDAVANNRVGGSGAVAATYLATQAPTDGTLIQAVTPTQLITPIRAPGVPTYKDITPIARIFVDPSTMYVHRDSPFQTIEEFVDYARENPGELTIGIGSAGSLEGLVIAEMQEAADIEVRIVPHEGGGDANVELLGQHLDAAIGEVGDALTQFENGDFRLLTVFQDDRLEEYADIPTFKELGYDVVANKFRGVFGPPGMDSAMAEAIAETLSGMYDIEPWATYWRDGNMAPAFLGPDEFAAFLDRSNGNIEAFLDSL